MPLGMLRLLALAMVLAVVCGCQSVNVPREALTPGPESLALRQLQTRRFDTLDEASLLAASTALLQDLGFNIDAAQSRLGLIVASKERDATETAQTLASLVAAVFGVNAPPDYRQTIRVCLVTRPAAGSTALRVTFQRAIWDAQNRLTLQEAVTDDEIYQTFFAKLSKAVFLEAHSL